jgi:hypothetical protein
VKTLWLTILGIIVVLMIVFAILMLPVPAPHTTALTLNYIGKGQFWLSNNTTRTLQVQLWYIETENGTNWTEWAVPNHDVELAPHSGTFDLILTTNQSLPTNSWRVRGVFGEELEGFAETRTAIKYYPTVVYHRLNTGDTNISLHPFPKGVTWYGNHQEFISPVVSGY